MSFKSLRTRALRSCLLLVFPVCSAIASEPAAVKLDESSVDQQAKTSTAPSPKKPLAETPTVDLIDRCEKAL